MLYYSISQDLRIFSKSIKTENKSLRRATLN